MMDWLKKNWILVVFVVIIVVVVSGWINSCNDNKDYKAQIKQLDERIAELKKQEAEALARAESAISSAENWEAEANKKEEEIEKLRTELKKLQGEKRKIERQIAKMTPDQIVNRTRDIIESKEVELRTIGVVFSIGASRKNLGILEQFSLCKRENTILTKSFNLCQGEVNDLKHSISDYKKAVDNLKSANDKCNLRTIEITQEFKLCEQSRKKRWWKGFLNGTAVGGGIIALLAILAK
jgi:peptidoglycan hydrolase CwlO-like protein